MMLKYAEIEAFTQAGLEALGYGTQDGPRMPVFHPGPPTIQGIYSRMPHGGLFLTVGNGTGLTTEDTYDRPFVVVRVLGKQNDYDYAETLAHDVDGLFLAVQNVEMGSSRVLYLTRNAPPQLVDLDGADRYHFQTTYIAEATR